MIKHQNFKTSNLCVHVWTHVCVIINLFQNVDFDLIEFLLRFYFKTNVRRMWGKLVNFVKDNNLLETQTSFVWCSKISNRIYSYYRCRKHISLICFAIRPYDLKLQLINNLHNHICYAAKIVIKEMLEISCIALLIGFFFLWQCLGIKEISVWKGCFSNTNVQKYKMVINNV